MQNNLVSGNSHSTLLYGGTIESRISLPTLNTNFPTYDSPIFNTKSTYNMQSKLAVFKVERDEKGDVKSSTFVKEFWVEKLPNVSIELLAVKELEPGFEPNDIVVKELTTVYL